MISKKSIIGALGVLTALSIGATVQQMTRLVS